MLDAGAGPGSLCWLLRQETKSLVGVTAEADGTCPDRVRILLEIGRDEFTWSPPDARRGSLVESVY